MKIGLTMKGKILTLLIQCLSGTPKTPVGELHNQISEIHGRHRDAPYSRRMSGIAKAL